MSGQRYLCIHGHFYQPPRENPWLEEIEPQDSAYPYPNWNARILAECYQPNAHARILDDKSHITQITNNYSRISFNFGPTLMSWLADKSPSVYQAIKNADADSEAYFGGHGSALAQVYNHMIMPLANRRDKVTQVLWGVRDFEHHFGRRPEGMWLAETAVDTETLEVLAEHNIRFTILAPNQAARIRAPGCEEWRDVSNSSIDPGRAYRAYLPSGRHIDLFFYDGRTSRAVAFEELLSDGLGFSQRLLSRPAGDEPLLLHIATDGETYGHHHRHGEMALAYALAHIEEHDLARITNYGEFLELHPATHEVEIVEQSSWSCAHGVERWRADCGCNSGGRPGWNQKWRKPLREALDALRDRAATIFADVAGALLSDPWAARDAYIEVINDRSAESIGAFLDRHALKPLSGEERILALQMLESQRNAMLMFTSCGWFFDDIAGTEAVQILHYAARVIGLLERVVDEPIEPRFLALLAEATSNQPREGNGRHIYNARARAARTDLRGVVAHYAVHTLFEDNGEDTSVYCYSIEPEDMQVRRAGKAKLTIGTVRATSQITLATTTLSFGALHLGDHNLTGGVRNFRGLAEYRTMVNDVAEAFARADLIAVQRELDRHFLELSFSLKSLFRADRDRVVARILDKPLADAEAMYQELYEDHVPLMRYLASLDMPLPKALRDAAKNVLNLRIRRALERDDPDLDAIHTGFKAAERIDLRLDAAGLGYAWKQTLERVSDHLVANPESLEELQQLGRIATLITTLDFEIDLWHVQNETYQLSEFILPRMSKRAASGDDQAISWVRTFTGVCDALRLNVDTGEREAAS
jgi:hypothetical protein